MYHEKSVKFSCWSTLIFCIYHILDPSHIVAEGLIQEQGPTSDWIKSFETKWHKYFSEERSWVDAMRTCAREGGYMATVDHVFVEHFLLRYRKPDTTGTWTGLTQDKQHRWWWYGTGNWEFYTRWAPGNPRNPASDNCMYLGVFTEETRPDGIWTADLCSNKHDFICEKDILPYTCSFYQPSRTYCSPRDDLALLLDIRDDEELPHEFGSSDCQDRCDNDRQCHMTIALLGSRESSCLFYQRHFQLLMEANMECSRATMYLEFNSFDRYDCSEFPVLRYTWKYKNDHEYKVFEENRTWADAKRICHSEGAYLAEITSAEENALIDGLRPLYKSYGATWIGLVRKTKTFMWENANTDATTGYTNWYDDTAVPSSDYNCGFLLYEAEHRGRWNAINCNQEKADFVCEKDYEGWIEHNGHEYKYFSPRAFTWAVAQKTCVDQGGYLAVIESVQENTFLDNNRMQQTFTDNTAYTWIGLLRNIASWKDTDPKSGWEWQMKTNSTVVYNNWHAPEPNNNNGLGEFCGSMYYKQDHRGQWNDLPCYYTRGYFPDTTKVDFFCERGAPCAPNEYRPKPADECKPLV